MTYYFSNNISDQCDIPLSLSVDELGKQLFNIFETNDFDDSGFINPLNDLDPDEHYFRDLLYGV